MFKITNRSFAVYLTVSHALNPFAIALSVACGHEWLGSDTHSCMLPFCVVSDGVMFLSHTPPLFQLKSVQKAHFQTPPDLELHFDFLN